MSRWHRFNLELRRGDFKTAGYILLIAISSLLLAMLLHLPHGAEHWSADWVTSRFSDQLPSQHPLIKLVYLDEATLDAYPYTSPTNRKLIAELTRALDCAGRAGFERAVRCTSSEETPNRQRCAGPAIIAFDLIFDRHTESANDDLLLETLRSARAELVLAASLDLPRTEEREFQRKFLEQANRPVGHLHFDEYHSTLVISDHVVRHMAEQKEEPYPESFSEVIAKRAGAHFHPRSDYIAWLRTPKDETDTFFSISAREILGRSGPTPDLCRLFDGKIVLVGGNFVDRDQHLTPLSVQDADRIPGLLIHAHILAQLLRGQSIGVLPLWAQLLIVLLAAGTSFWIGRNVAVIQWIFVELLLVAGLVAVAVASFVGFRLILPYNALVFSVLVAAAAGHYSKRSHGSQASTREDP
jgi:CHASE2 domain-containing sensor protein